MTHTDPLLSRLFPPNVIAVETETTQSLFSALHPDEAELVGACASKRIQEFAAGRFCARQALSKLGSYEGPLLANSDRTPQWPNGVVGTITHTPGYCAAAVAADRDFVGIGVDAEPAQAVGTGLISQVCTAEDMYSIKCQDPEMDSRWATILFTAKEAFYKCQYAVSRTPLTFQDVNIRLNGNTFSVHSNHPVVQWLQDRWPLTGRFTEERGLVISAMVFHA